MAKAQSGKQKSLSLNMVPLRNSGLTSPVGELGSKCRSPSQCIDSQPEAPKTGPPGNDGNCCGFQESLGSSVMLQGH